MCVCVCLYVLVVSLEKLVMVAQQITYGIYVGDNGGLICVLQQSGPPMYPSYGPAAAPGPYVPYPQHFPPAPPPHHHHHPGMGPVAGPHHLHHPPMMHGPPGTAAGAQPPPAVGVQHHHHQCNSHGHHVHGPAGEWCFSR